MVSVLAFWTLEAHGVEKMVQYLFASKGEHCDVQGRSCDLK